jgi:mannose-6-phosphate isomerase-like protein (cupin superfamily)
MIINKKLTIIDIIKLNHWLNAKKITNQFINKKQKSLTKKLKTKKNFSINVKEKNFINSILSIPTEKIILSDKIPDYMYWSKNIIMKTKRPIKRDGIHFYNYYSLPTPSGFVGPVILDILCPKDRLPKLNNGHLEQAITVNLGKSDIYGRWGKHINKINFSKISFNNSKTHSWIIGDTYVEPTYCPHSYSRATDENSQILSYTAKSPIEKVVKNLNNWSINNYKKLMNNFQSNDIRSTILDLYLDNNGLSLKYLSKYIDVKINNSNQIIKNKKILTKVCKLLKINHNLFAKKIYNSEDVIGKTYLSYKDSFKTIRKYKSYTIASMASSERYTDLFGYFIKVSKKKKIKDLSNYASSHYLVTEGNFYFNIDNKIIKIKKGDCIWISSFKEHGFSGNGSLLRISNGENFDSSDLSEILKLYNPKKTLGRSYKDKISWGYE